MRFGRDSPTESAQKGGKKSGCTRDVTKTSNDPGVSSVDIECDHLGRRCTFEVYGAWLNTGCGSELVVLLSNVTVKLQ